MAQIDDKAIPEGIPSAPFTPAGGSPLTDKLTADGVATIEWDGPTPVIRPASNMTRQQAWRIGAVNGVKDLLRLGGYDPNSPNLKDTPERVVRAFLEMAAGRSDGDHNLFTAFDETGYDEMIVVRGVRFAALCEHHLLPFFGTADVAYLPNPEKKKVLGLSKLARLVAWHAVSLGTQERLTHRIADDLNACLAVSPVGVGVRLTAAHTCMGVRGACQPDALTVTTAVRGAFKTDAATRAEFLNAIRSN